jgi:hypothetical protein
VVSGSQIGGGMGEEVRCIQGMCMQRLGRSQRCRGRRGELW